MEQKYHSHPPTGRLEYFDGHGALGDSFSPHKATHVVCDDADGILQWTPFAARVVHVGFPSCPALLLCDSFTA